VASVKVAVVVVVLVRLAETQSVNEVATVAQG
jgi:hypothetical protein